ncbi:hypothetical protein J43TS3_29800 [Ornithinibacillus bavariensis]|uniref:Uncharacterized protein n=1 Tax=Ornithinibacillus bavariensis TaxID=545502 RepID=A0A919X9L6_9BACI|nr:hypothetical protein J43TS3_29800 [Ornithinibacillus bavariensis]
MINALILLTNMPLCPNLSQIHKRRITRTGIVITVPMKTFRLSVIAPNKGAKIIAKTTTFTRLV